MEQSVGCAEWLILLCCTTCGVEWNGQTWRNYPAGHFKKKREMPHWHVLKDFLEGFTQPWKIMD